MQRTPKGAPKRPQRTPKATKGPQMEAKGSPMDTKGSPKGTQKAPWSDPRIDPKREPAPEILFSPKCCKNVVNYVLLDVSLQSGTLRQGGTCLSKGTGSALKEYHCQSMFSTTTSEIANYMIQYDTTRYSTILYNTIRYNLRNLP